MIRYDIKWYSIVIGIHDVIFAYWIFGDVNVIQKEAKIKSSLSVPYVSWVLYQLMQYRIKWYIIIRYNIILNDTLFYEMQLYMILYHAALLYHVILYRIIYEAILFHVIWYNSVCNDMILQHIIKQYCIISLW